MSGCEGMMRVWLNRFRWGNYTTAGGGEGREGGPIKVGELVSEMARVIAMANSFNIRRYDF